MTTIVALDLETTGLDPHSDRIIEIGAVKFSGSRIEDEWSTLINPGKPIPREITQLTGISNDMVSNAPPIQAVLQELEDFVGEAHILGQNIGFDLAFLHNQGLFHNNPFIDTYELASVLLPTAGRYNLGALGQELNVLLPGDAHRALYDAQLTRMVFLQLCDIAATLPIDIVADFVRLSEPINWGAGWVFKNILLNNRDKLSPRKINQKVFGPLFEQSSKRLEKPLDPVDEPTPLNSDDMAALLEHGGPFSKYFQGYEQRSQQIEMLRAVTEAISNSQHLMVEAGTGTGKSYAYLIPAAYWAIQNGHRVVVSTNTINLQDQLIRKDIPDLVKILDLPIKAAVLKGRSNYICPHKVNLMRKRGPENADEMRVLAKLLVWLFQGGTGDRNEINLNGPIEREIWQRLSAEDENCRVETCPARIDGICPFYQARQQAHSAHIVIVNHALLLADVATGNRVIPDYDYLIVDEAHHMENATTSSLSYRLRLNDLIRMLRELGSVSSGVFGRQMHLLKQLLLPADFAAYQKAVQRASDLAFRLEHDLKAFFLSLDNFMTERREGRAIPLYGQNERVVPATRTQPSWADTEISWDTSQETMKLLLNLVAEIHKSVANVGEDLSDDIEDTQNNLANVYRRMDEAMRNIAHLVFEPQDNNIYWIEIQPRNNHLVINIAPLNIGPMMQKFIWHEKECVILTSATLTTNNEFDYMRSRLYAEDADELSVGSPFDYESAVLLYVVNDIPEPFNTSNYQAAINRALIQTANATGGRMLALFTSYKQLKQTSRAIENSLNNAGIAVFEQGEGASPNTLLENFKSAQNGVLLGTRSFWEGVDIPGEKLSVLALTKLPFDVPSDPIIAARGETFDDPFGEYMIPEAILRFRQGFGRLIRSETDRGIAIILDKRVISKTYGRSFLESLPQCTFRSGRLQDLPRAAAQWLNI
jgi:DNA polymerase-3 subunit epsilon/ATP-dependent DNA helicase DinG